MLLEFAQQAHQVLAPRRVVACLLGREPTKGGDRLVEPLQLSLLHIGLEELGELRAVRLVEPCRVICVLGVATATAPHELDSRILFVVVEEAEVGQDIPKPIGQALEAFARVRLKRDDAVAQRDAGTKDGLAVFELKPLDEVVALDLEQRNEGLWDRGFVRRAGELAAAQHETEPSQLKPPFQWCRDIMSA